MTRKSDIFTSACGLAVALVLCACTAGCDRAPEKAAPAPVAVQPAASPSDDAAYQAQLQGTMADRKKKLETLSRVNARLRAMEDRARAALPSNATPKQVRAKIGEDPLADREYRELEHARAESQAAAKDFSKAQELIRAHHMQRKTTGGHARGAAATEK